MFIPMQVKWVDKTDKSEHTIQLDVKDITRIAKKLELDPREVHAKLHEGKLVETKLHTYQVV